MIQNYGLLHSCLFAAAPVRVFTNGNGKHSDTKVNTHLPIIPVRGTAKVYTQIAVGFFPAGSPVFLTLPLTPAIKTKQEIPPFAGSENQRPGGEHQNQLVYIL